MSESLRFLRMTSACRVKACAIPRDQIGVYEIRLALPEDECGWGDEGSGIPRERGARSGNRQAELGGTAKAVPRYESFASLKGSTCLAGMRNA